MAIISEYVLKQICLHSEREYPFEACGLIIGPTHKENAIGIFPIRNIQNDLHAQDPEKYTRDAKTAYYMDPKQMNIVAREAKDKDFDTKVVYHSHPDHDVYFSAEDKLMAAPWGEPNDPKIAWVVIAVKEGKAEAASEFTWDEEKKDYVERKLNMKHA